MTQSHFYLKEGPYRPQKGTRFSWRFSTHPPECDHGEKKKNVGSGSESRRGVRWHQQSPNYVITIVLYPLTSFASATSGQIYTVVTTNYQPTVRTKTFSWYDFVSRCDMLSYALLLFSGRTVVNTGFSGAAHPYNANIPLHSTLRWTSSTPLLPRKQRIISLLTHSTTWCVSHV